MMEAHNDLRTEWQNGLFKLASDLFFVIDAEGKVANSNHAVEKTLGWTARDLNGRLFLEIVDVDDHASLVLAIDDLRRSGCTASLEIRALHKDRSYRWLRLNSKGDEEAGLVYLAATDITPHKEDEAEREQLYDIASDILIISNRDGPFTKPNPSVERVLGWTAEEMASRPWTDFVHPDDIAASMRKTETLYSGQGTLNFENRYRHKYGGYRWLAWRTKLDPATGRVYAGATDVTSRKQIEEEKDRFFEIASDILVITRPDGFFAKINPACERVLGWTQEEMTSQPWTYFVHPKDLEKSERATKDLFEGDQTFLYENRYRHRDGSYRWLSWRARANVEAGMIYASAVDITVRRQIEEERERFFEVASDLLVVSEGKGNFVKVNPAWERLLGWTQAEIVQMKWLDLVHPDDVERTRLEAQAILNGQEAIDFENRFRSKAGDYTWLNWRSKLNRETGCIYSAAVDISTRKRIEAEQKQLERDLRCLNETLEFQVAERTSELNSTLANLHQLVEVQTKDLVDAKNQAEAANLAKTDFLANMSHEIRTPMNAVIGLAHVLSRTEPLSDRQRDCIGVLKTSADSLLSLINDLLDITKIEAGSLELERTEFNLFEVLSSVVDMMQPTARSKGIALELECASSTIKTSTFIGDTTRLRQVIVNLCGNAIKFTEKGFVHVSATCRKRLSEDGDEITITVEDTGIGVAPERVESIFSKFAQADSSISRKYGGSGLGLAITKSLIEAMGGSVTVTSKLNVGSTFKLIMPLERHVGPSRLDNDDLRLSALASGNGFRLLIVEDHSANIMVVTSMLEGLNFKFDVVQSGHDALELVKSRPPYDGILMDVQMPGIDGLETTRLIRQHENSVSKKAVPIIGVTAHAMLTDRERCLSAGMNEYISKPLNSELLKQKLAAVLAVR